MTQTLPRPHHDRWKPLRAGLVDIFYYDREEFWFRDGRLLLRGNNGTGKSKVLALMLPFLFDGELAAHRVEPDGDPKKRMEWNLLLGGAHPQPERLGYTWLELGRRNPDGSEEFCTLGCGIKAVTGRGVARHWFFVTSQRIGTELQLVDATEVALTRDRLGEAIGPRGAVYDRAASYRGAVDEALFGLGEHRYTALVNLLIQLRAPQLSKRPSAEALSSALTEALPPMDPSIIAVVADAFRSLDEDRDALAAMEEAGRASETFLHHYRTYARIGARRRARQPRTAQSRYEKLREELGAAEKAVEQADRELAALEDATVRLQTERAQLTGRDQALRAGPEMRSQRELELAAQQAERTALELASTRTEAERAQAALDRHEARVQASQARLTTAAEELRRLRQSAVAEAAAGLVDREHHAVVELALARRTPGEAGETGETGDDAPPSLPTLRRRADEIPQRQQNAVDHLRRLLRAVADARRNVLAARQRVADLDQELAQLEDERGQGAEMRAAAADALARDVRGLLARSTELIVTDLAGLFAQLELWSDTLDGPNPAAVAVADAADLAHTLLSQDEVARQLREQGVAERRDRVTDEIARLEAGEDTSPPAPHTRDHAARENRLGAPLWRLVDFADDVADADRAGIEAALEASGLLDAWVTPAGEALDPGTEDVVLRGLAAESPPSVSPTSAPTSVPTLMAVLHPAVDREDPMARAVSDAVVGDLLAAVGLGTSDAACWVDADGRFRLGVLEGEWHKPAAVYMGRGAREAARRHRLAELRIDLGVLDAEASDLASERHHTEQRKATLRSEVAALPDDTALRTAAARLAAIDAAAQRCRERRSSASHQLAEAESAADASRRAVEETAAELRLPGESEALDAVAEALGRYRVALARLWPAVETDDEARRQAGQAVADRERAQADHGRHRARGCELEGSAAAAAEHFTTLQNTVGAAVAELQRQLTEVHGSLRRCDQELRQADEDSRRTIERRGQADGRRTTLSSQLAEVTEERTEAADRLRRFAATGLLEVAVPGLAVPEVTESWAPSPAMQLARDIERELATVDDGETAWDRASGRVNVEFKRLNDALHAHGHSAVLDMRDDAMMVEVGFQGRTMTVPKLVEAVAIEVAGRRRLLDEHERVILENHLINEAAGHLAERIQEAEALVQRMNDEMTRRPTSTGMRLRMVWDVVLEGSPSGLAAARQRLLRQTLDAWSDADRSAVGGFLQAAIRDERNRDETGTWLEHLTHALDYRRWHRFTIQRHQNGTWRSATGPASGGERVLTATIPLFAAASAHYQSARIREAPRIVTLDEAFAGVDDDSRAKCMGMLAAFDLDVVLTSEREWGCYPEVPGLAIAHLSRTDDVAAVLVSRWEWDGRQRVTVDRPGTTSAADANGATPTRL